MKTIAAALLLLIVPTGVQATDKALILNDQEQFALRQIIDAAIRQGGATQLSRNAFVLMDKLDAAGTVTEKVEQKEKGNEPPLK